MSKALEPIDISIHVAIAAAFVVLIWALGYFVLGFNGLQYVAAPIAVAVFLIREGHQQLKKNVPPKKWWYIWQWGKNGLVEGLCTIPATALGIGICALILWAIT